MDFVRVRHPQTGHETRVAAFQYEETLAKLGFTLVEEATAPAPVEQEAPAVPPAETGGIAPDPLAEAVGDAAVAEALREAGFDSPEAIGAASDEELRAVKGVGEGRVKRLREYAEAANEQEQDA